MAQTPLFTKDLLDWYKKNARDLPWRRTNDPYKIWISEVMLQQTTVNAVIPHYKRWLKEFTRIDDVARAPLQKILKSWQGLGYYQRAKNLHKSARLICKNYGGRIPEDPLVLRQLPGFGPYTVGAVLSIAYNKKFPIIDANVRRVVMRQLALKGFADSSHDLQILRFLEEQMPEKEINSFNQGLMELGALICRNNEPLCSVCPVRSGCKAYGKGWQEIIPTPRRKSIKDVDVVVALIEKRGKYFIQKRPSSGLFADLWEFPGGKIEKGEDPKDALLREIQEELNISIETAEPLFNVRQFYTQFRANLHVFSCRVNPSPTIDRTHRWVGRNELNRYPMPSGSAKIVDNLR